MNECTCLRWMVNSRNGGYSNCCCFCCSDERLFFLFLLLFFLLLLFDIVVVVVVVVADAYWGFFRLLSLSGSTYSCCCCVSVVDGFRMRTDMELMTSNSTATRAISKKRVDLVNFIWCLSIVRVVDVLLLNAPTLFAFVWKVSEF